MIGFARRDVVAADGRVWRVGIRWFPRPPRWLGWGFRRGRERGGQEHAGGSDWLDALNALDVPDGGSDVLGAVAVVVVAIVVLVVAWLFVLPLLVFFLDALLVLLVAIGAVGAHMVLRRPWVVVARTSGEQHEWPIVGWRTSRRAAQVVVDGLRKGLPIDAFRADAGSR